MARFTRRLVVCWTLLASAASSAGERPNLLWLTSEDNGPQLGCYGDTHAVTPNLDALAARGTIYQRVWSVAPVCAPARTAIITGLYPSSTGAEHMRSLTRLPAGVKMFPQYLREAGYYCSNNSKEDYNLEKPGRVWDESSGKAHWRNREPGQPFFAVFNHTITHESQVRSRPHQLVHDPARVRVPVYHPDVPEVRRDWAQYYDRMTEMDAQAGVKLRELEEAGLAEETIVFYFGDHGPGLPRSKRYCYDSGLHVPLIVYVPPKFRSLATKDYAPGGKSDRLLSFVDLAPTALSLAGIQPPDFVQGKAFLGPHAAPPTRYLFGLRGRMDERYDFVRSVRDERYVYIRNYMPHRICGQHVAYMFETPTTQVWRALFDAGRLLSSQSQFWQPKPAEELYDLETDPDEVHSLHRSPQHQKILERLRRAQQEQVLATRDVGFLPEGEIHSRSAGSTPLEMAQDNRRYPLKKILAMAELAAGPGSVALPRLKKGLNDNDSAVRYWAAMGLLIRGREGFEFGRDGLWRALRDSSPYVRVVAAEAIGKHGSPADSQAALDVLLPAADVQKNGLYVAVAALNAIDELDGRAVLRKEEIEALPRRDPAVNSRMSDLVNRLITKILADLEPARGLSGG